MDANVVGLVPDIDSDGALHGAKRFAGHLAVRRERHFELNRTRGLGGERLGIEKTGWISLGAMCSAAKAVLPTRSTPTTVDAHENLRTLPEWHFRRSSPLYPGL